jgi:hypothetical protein
MPGVILFLRGWPPDRLDEDVGWTKTSAGRRRRLDEDVGWTKTSSLVDLFDEAAESSGRIAIYLEADDPAFGLQKGLGVSKGLGEFEDAKADG